MSLATPSADYFRLAPTKGAVGSVDRRANIIHGVNIIQAGKLNDSRPWYVDAKTLEQVAELGNRPNRGLKARFTHPNLSNDGMGSYLGRWKNFRVDGDRVRADLHISDVAFESPRGDLASHVLDLAEEDPEAFGNSIVVTLDDQAMDEDAEADAARKPMRIRRLHASDIVDEPAATRGGLFSLTGSPAELPVLATNLLDHYFSDSDPAAIRARAAAFLDTYLAHRFPMSQAPAAPADPITSAAAAPAPAEPSAPLHAPAAAAAAPQAAATSAEIEQAAALAENQRVRSIAALCQQAGFPELAERLTGHAPKFTVEQASAELLQATLRRTTGLGPAPATPTTADPNERFREEYRSHAALHQQMGVSEEMYLRSRRIDEGLEPLQPAKK